MTLSIMTNGHRRDFSVLVIVGGEHDGKPATGLRLGTLYRELERMKVRGINASMGKLELLKAFFDQTEAVAKTIRPPVHRRHRPQTLDGVVARQAIDLIARHAMNEDTPAVPRSGTPLVPIATTRVR